MAGPIINQAAYESATRARIKQNARTTWRRTYGPLAERILDDAVPRFVSAKSDYPTENPTFLDKLAVALDDFGKLSEKQTNAYISALDKMQERKAQWEAKRAEKNATLKYLGQIGKRETFSLTVKRVTSYIGQSHSYYDSGIRVVTIMEDSNGNVCVYTGGHSLAEQGANITVTATVKDHKEYKGTKQTVLQRPKVKE